MVCPVLPSPANSRASWLEYKAVVHWYCPVIPQHLSRLPSSATKMGRGEKRLVKNLQWCKPLEQQPAAWYCLVAGGDTRPCDGVRTFYRGKWTISCESREMVVMRRAVCSLHHTTIWRRLNLITLYFKLSVLVTIDYHTIYVNTNKNS